MKPKNETDILNITITLLQNKQAAELKLLKEQFYVTYESLKPINLIKNSFKEVSVSPDMKDNILNNVIGLTAGYLSKKVLVGTSHNPIKKLLGALFQLGVSNLVAKHPDTIKSTGENIFHRIFKSTIKAKPSFSSNEN